jgi:protoporphyrinogen oxidase
MKIGIIGGGVMGCVLAYRLSQKGYEVHLVESAHQLGGLSTWFNYGDFIFDKYYHVILKSDNHLLDLIHTLQLSSHLHWQETKTGFLWKGRYISMSNHWEFLKFPALNLFQKFRLGAGIIWNNSVSNPRQLDGYTAQAWLTKIFGKSVYDTIWDPLLESKFGILKNEIPGTIIWSTMRRYASTRSKGDGKEWMGHLKGGGLKVLLEKLAGEISKKNGQFHLNTKVESIGYDDQRNVRVQCADKTLIFDRVISTVPSTLLEKLTPGLPELIPQGPKPTPLGVIRLALVLKHSLTPFYVTNLLDKGGPYTGIIEVNRLGSPDEFADHAFVMLPRYDVPQSEWFNKTDDEIKEAFIEHLKKSQPDIEDNILRSYVNREKIVQALWIHAPPPTDKPLKTADKKIWNINNALAGYSTLNNNSVVEVANNAAKEW